MSDITGSSKLTGGNPNPLGPAPPLWSQFAPQLSAPVPTLIEQILMLVRDGVIGFKEARSWVAIMYPIFKEVRDPAVDAYIDTIARERSVLFDRLSAEEDERDR